MIDTRGRENFARKVRRRQVNFRVRSGIEQFLQP
jgi:hypothetical protein